MGGQVEGRTAGASGCLVSAHTLTPSTLHYGPWGREGAGADGGRGGLQHPGAGGAQQDRLEVRILPAETGGGASPARHSPTPHFPPPHLPVTTIKSINFQNLKY